MTKEMASKDINVIVVKKAFTYTTSSGFSYLHKTHYKKFMKFIKCFINNLSIRKSSEICTISISCSFDWRHKIMSFLKLVQQQNKQFNGLIEIDEIYFSKNLQKVILKAKLLQNNEDITMYQI